MKKLLTFIFLTVTLTLAADNYQASFNACLGDGKLQAVDSILKVRSGDELALAEDVFARLTDIYNSGSRDMVESALPLADKAAKRFSDNQKIINMAGGMNFAVGNNDAALAYFEESSRIAPGDAIPLTNIAYIHYQQGDTAKALEIYRKIEKGDYDSESREVAGQMIAEITAPTEEMQEYYYFFRYLPGVASQLVDPAEFLDVEMINRRLPAAYKLRSPFADTDIETYDVPQQDGEQKAVVWTFPMPHEIPLCRYVAFVADGKGACKVLTLEKSLDEYWILGTVAGTGHVNFGGALYPDDAAAFVKILRDKSLLK